MGSQIFGIFGIRKFWFTLGTRGYTRSSRNIHIKTIYKTRQIQSCKQRAVPLAPRVILVSRDLKIGRFAVENGSCYCFNNKNNNNNNKLYLERVTLIT